MKKLTRIMIGMVVFGGMLNAMDQGSFEDDTGSLLERSASSVMSILREGSSFSFSETTSSPVYSDAGRFNTLSPADFNGLPNYPLARAVLENDEQLVRELLALHTQMNVNLRCEKHGVTVVHFAAMKATPAVMGLLHARGADLDARDNDGRTPLSYAVKAGNYDVVNYLLRQQTVQVNSRNNKGRTAFHDLASCKPTRDQQEVFGSILLSLVQAGLDTAIKDTSSAQTGLHVAARCGNSFLLSFMHECGLLTAEALEAGDAQGRTLLMLAAENTHYETVLLLVGYGACKNAQDRDGKTVFDYAINGADDAIVELLTS